LSNSVGNSIIGAITVTCGILAALTGSALLRKMMMKYEEMRAKDHITAEVLELIRVEKCTTIMTVGSLCSVIFLVGFLIPSFFMGSPWNYILDFVGLTFGEFSFFIAGPSIGISIMMCVPTHLRGQANAVSVFIMHSTGDFPAPFIVGFLFDTVGYLLGMLILSSWMFFAFLLWFFALKITKKNLKGSSKTWEKLMPVSTTE
jgi:MFS family permease